MTTKQLQCLLAYLGFDPGRIDGLWGKDTRQAVIRFQQAQGLDADGIPGERTCSALRRSVAREPEKTEAPKETAGAEVWLAADGFYHIPKDLDVRLSKNFSAREFRCGLGSGCACTETVIDPKLAALLQNLRDHFQAEITVTSGYRCPEYNRRVGGAEGSRHTRGQAADITIRGVPPVRAAQTAERMGVQGIGLYETGADGYFVHLDTRQNRSFWYGREQAVRTTFLQEG